jgi:hypothetical protein
MPFPKRDHTGNRFGRLVVVGDAPRGDKTKHRWVACRCDCGKDYAVRLSALRDGRTQSCGCLQLENLATVHEARQISLIGRRFGRLEVIAKAPSRKIGKKWHGYWECRCDCGTITVVQRSSLTSRATKSCGCYLQKEMAIRALKHGGSRWPEFRIWNSMRQRCENPKNPAYKHYGGRGITVCDRWSSFANFIKDVGRRPQPGFQLDRRDNDAGYSKENCRWVSRDENMQNRSFVSRDEADALREKLVRYEELYGPLPEVAVVGEHGDARGEC